MDGSFLVETTTSLRRVPGTCCLWEVRAIYSSERFMGPTGPIRPIGPMSRSYRRFGNTCLHIDCGAARSHARSSSSPFMFDGLCAGVGRGFHRRNVADDRRCDHGIADLVSLGRMSSTLAAFSIASSPSTRATRPRVSRIPNACCWLPFWG